MKQTAEQLLKKAETFYQQGNFEEAIKALERINPNEKEWYALAQFNLGIIYNEEGEIEASIIAYEKVPESQEKPYAMAQFNLGFVYNKKGELKKSIVAYEKIPESQEEPYAKAQYNLGIFYYKKNDLENSIKAFRNVPKSQVALYRKANILLNALESKKKDNLFKIYSSIEEILRKLQVTTSQWNGVEFNIAHYTRTSTAFLLLQENKKSQEDEKKNKKPSPFRLSSINGVNDPTEGDILYQWLGFDWENNDKAKNNLDTAVFISCFTFNHDSLNQFRLYGKENNEEATGVSLVFKGADFFEQGFDSSFGVNYISSNQEITRNIGKNSNSSIIEDIIFSDNKEDNKVKKLPLYRCIYLDLGSLGLKNDEYINLSSRERITFSREKNPNLNVGVYMNKLNSLKHLIKGKLIEIKEILKEIENEQDKIIANEILLPLRYLVKHSAFEGEQEARMFYITSLFDPKIQTSEDNTQMYVEYAEQVKPAIHKIYLSSGASPYKDLLRIAIQDKEGRKVEMSCNPFRNKKY